MKHFLPILLCLLPLFSCGKSDQPQTPDEQPGTPTDQTPTAIAVPDFARGADISWVSEMEHDGRTFKKKDGSKADIFDVLKEVGINAIRLRVWVNPTGGWSGKDDVVALAKRAGAAGMALMVDFHYSDFFADPSRQDVPAAWKADTGDLPKMIIHVKEHTTEVLTALKDAGVTPAWVQIGNETLGGMLWPTGEFGKNHWEQFVRLYNAGYTAAKDVFPGILAMPHLNNAFKDNSWWFDKFKSYGGKMDMIALSHYPQYESNPSSCNTQAVTQIRALSAKYGVKVMVAEVGVKTNAGEAQARELLSSFMTSVKALDQCVGVFYWEPEVDGSWKPAVYQSRNWNAYDMGAFTPDGKATSVMDCFAE